MTTVIPIITRSFVHPTSKTSVADTVAEHGAYAAGFIKNLALTLTGTTVIGVMGVGKSVAPDHTFFDKFSLVGIVLGAITALIGAIGLYRGKKSTDAAGPQQTPFTVRDPLPGEISKFLHAVNQNPHERFEVSNDVVSGNASSTITDLRTNSLELLKRWTDNQFGNILRANEGRNELIFKNGKGAGAKDDITSTDLKDKVAILIGYAVGSRNNIALDTPSDHIVNNNLNLACIERGNSSWERLVPDEFTLLYAAARHYKINHMDVTDSITSTTTPPRVKLREVYPQPTATDPNPAPVTDNIDLSATVTALTTGVTPANVKTSVESVAKSRNYLMILQKGIEFVLKVEQDKKNGVAVDASTQRDADILRSALVAGLGLKVSDLDDTLDKLRKIKVGDTGNTVASGMGTQEGLDAKVGRLNTCWGQIESAARANNNSGITIRPTEQLKFQLFNQAGLITVS